jgi:hypothetical protein
MKKSSDESHFEVQSLKVTHLSRSGGGSTAPTADRKSTATGDLGAVSCTLALLH